MKEKLKNQLLAEMGKANNDYIVSIVLEKPELIESLVEFSLSNEYPLDARASWVLTYLIDMDYQYVKPYIDAICKKVSIKQNDAVKRNLLRILSVAKIHEDFHGEIMDLCFEVMISAKEKPAARVHGMQILYNLSNVYSELKPELIATIQNELPNGSTGFKNRGMKLIKKLQKEIK